MLKNVLFEIGCEEIPAGYIVPAKEQLSTMVSDYLKTNRVAFKNIASFATPRRIAVLIDQIAEKSEERTEEFFGPPVSVGADSPAAKGFAAKHSVSADKLLKKAKDKGEYFCVVKKTPGEKTEKLLKSMFLEVLGKISFPKSMIWESSCVRFARPIRTLICLYGSTLIKFSYAGVKTGNFTYGLHTLSRKKILVSSPDKYISALRNSCIIVEEKDRKDAIVKSVEQVEKKIKGKVILDESLLEEINYLIEHPVAILGNYDEKYLKLPKEVLVNCMKKKQKFFAVENSKGGLLNLFIGIRNGVSENQQLVKEGYEKVLVARLSDAEFFYNNDLKAGLESKYEKLKGVMFHEKLGSVYDKTLRVKQTALYINEQLRMTNSSKIESSAGLIKSDLVSEMVFEYPELQGIMGKLYTLACNGDPEVADSIEEHYLPITVDAALPESSLGTVMALSDKIDTLCGYFAVGLTPSGSQDPFGLRRISAGILRIIMEKGLALNLSEVVKKSISLLPENAKTNAQAQNQVMEFLKTRLENLLEAKKYKPDEIKAVISSGFEDLVDLKLRLEALSKIRVMPDFLSLAASFKRTANILKQAKKNNINIPESANADLLKEEQEKRLLENLSRMEQEINELLEKKQYLEVLQKMVKIKPEVDAFFEKIMVMCEDENLRANRLALLNYIAKMFFKILDFGALQG